MDIELMKMLSGEEKINSKDGKKKSSASKLKKQYDKFNRYVDEQQVKNKESILERQNQRYKSKLSANLERDL